MAGRMPSPKVFVDALYVREWFSHRKGKIQYKPKDYNDASNDANLIF